MSEIINYSRRLDELPEGSIIVNGNLTDLNHPAAVFFCKRVNEYGDYRWYPCDRNGKIVKVSNEPINNSFTSDRIFLPAYYFNRIYT